MTPTITAFERSPDSGMGLARDTRVRWALEEVGQSYKVRGVSFAGMKEPAHLALHPFGKIPTCNADPDCARVGHLVVLHERQAAARNLSLSNLTCPGLIASHTGVG